MSPQEKVDETLELDTILPNNYRQISDKIRIINREKRLNLYHYIVHFIALIIILPFIGMIVAQMEVPQVYATIVSVVVGFYFAKSLFSS